MINKIESIIDITGYTLSADSHDELLAIRDMLFLMAQITYALTHEGENSAFLSIRRSQMGKFFEQIGLQIDDVMATAKPTAKVVDVPSHVH
jgi:hypothetical protein